MNTNSHIHKTCSKYVVIIGTQHYDSFMDIYFVAFPVWTHFRLKSPVEYGMETQPKNHYPFLLVRLIVVFHQVFLYFSLLAVSSLIHLFPSQINPSLSFSPPSPSPHFHSRLPHFSPLCSLIAVMYQLPGLHFSSSSSSLSSSTSPQWVSSSDVGDSVGSSGGTTEQRTGCNPGGESLWKLDVKVRLRTVRLTIQGQTKPKKSLSICCLCSSVWAALLKKDEMFLFLVQSVLFYIIDFRYWCKV